MTKNLLPGLTILVFAVGCMSAGAKLSDDPSGLRVLADNELGQSAAPRSSTFGGTKSLRIRPPLSALSPPIHRMTGSTVIMLTPAS